MAMLPGMSMMPGGLDLGSLASFALQDPNAAASMFAQQGPPPANLLGRIGGGLGSMMQPGGAAIQGVQTPEAPKPQFSGGISGAQQAPGPGGQSAPTSLSAITGQSPLFTRHGQVPTLGSLIAGGR